MKRVLFLLFLFLSVAGLYLWSIWPATTLMPESWIEWRLNAAIPQKEARGSWEARGKYLVTVAGCAMCHTPYSWIGPHDQSVFQGGMRVRWNNDLGERVASNLTPDPETGIGTWTEEEFVTAMKSGLYPDGRLPAGRRGQAHWQAMPWDMHSNWSLDDMRAMYRYLMTLDPKPQKKSAPVHGPLPENDTFYFGT